MKPLVSAIVLNYRSPFDTVKCVQALLKQTIADRLEILVVDNHSEDESVATVRARFHGEPKVKFIEMDANRGYAKGNNVASRHASGEYILIINPDNVLPPTALEEMLDVLKKNPKAGVVGPALVYPSGTVRPSARSFPTLMELVRKRLSPAVWQGKYDEERSKKSVEPRPVDWLVGACLLLKRDLFQQLEGFDTRFFLFFEDIDLCRRIQEKGLQVVYAPSIKAADRERRLSGASVASLLKRKTTWIHVASAVKYFWKWRGKSLPVKVS